MEKYQITSLFYIFLIYCLAILPTIILAINKNNYKNKKVFTRTICISILIESIIFSLIYIFPEKVISFFSNKTNIQNYSIYCLKIIFISSSISGTHFLFPLHLYFSNKKKKCFLTFFLKIFYIPVFFLGCILFNIKGGLFSIHFCDLVYSLYLIFQYKFSKI